MSADDLMSHELNTAESDLRPFFTYFGGKWRTAHRYPAPTHDLIVEPFAGSAGYAVRYSDRDVLLVDLDERVVGAWEYLIHATPAEVLSLPLYDGTWESVDDLDIPQGARWLIGFWLHKGSTGRLRPSTWMTSGVRPKSYWGVEVRDRIATQVPRIKHWQVRQGTYADIGNATATWYIDPPYEVAGKGYRYSTVDYQHLAQWCRERAGQVIVCENEGAEWLPFEHFRVVKASPGSTRTGVSREVVWTALNYPHSEPVESEIPYDPPRYPVLPRVPCECHPVELRAWNGGRGRTEHQGECEGR